MQVTHEDDTVQCLGILRESPCAFFFSEEEEEDAAPPGSRGFLPLGGLAPVLAEGSRGSSVSFQSCGGYSSVKHIHISDSEGLIG